MTDELVWFSSDWHMGHDNVIKMSNRPFANIDEMHNVLIANWNSVVHPEDTAYLLGDMVWTTKYLHLLDQLNGNLHLVIGNHDNQSVCNWRGWKSVHEYLRLKIDKDRLILCHYPIEAWHGQHHDAIHLHGHIHAGISHKISNIPNRYDVGVDSWNMYPVSATKLIQYDKINSGYYNG
jgi:calcineurin-like phosphoesterase family protein